MKSKIALALILTILGSIAPSPKAQAIDPTTLPLANFSNVTAAGSFRWDWSDGAGGDLSYGAQALGVSEDGNFLYISCHDVLPQRGIAKISIPALGGLAQVVDPCRGPNLTELHKLHPDPSATVPLIGGVLEQSGRVVVAGVITYDASGLTKASHWSGPSLQNLVGPFKGTVAPGFVKSQLATIPIEWRAVLGGPALASAGYTSIISRASYGASVSVFDPADVTADNFPMKMLLGCPHAVPSCITYGTPTSNDYNGSELSGGIFIVPGTRTLAQIEREASGPTCYGYATRDPNLHGQPHLDAVYCYSLSDPLNEKGPKGYPYRLVAKLYDLNELLQVKAGTKQPWDVKQYATIDLPGSDPGIFVKSGAFNPVRCEYYLAKNVGGGINTIYVYRGFGCNAPPPPPPPPPPTLTLDADKTTITEGESIELHGTSANAVPPGHLVAPDGISVDVSPLDDWRLTVAPIVSGSYTFTAANQAGTVAAISVDITVNAPPPPPPPPPPDHVCSITYTLAPPPSSGAAMYVISCVDPLNQPLPVGTSFTIARPPQP